MGERSVWTKMAKIIKDSYKVDASVFDNSLEYFNPEMSKNPFFQYIYHNISFGQIKVGRIKRYKRPNTYRDTFAHLIADDALPIEIEKTIPSKTIATKAGVKSKSKGKEKIPPLIEFDSMGEEKEAGAAHSIYYKGLHVPQVALKRIENSHGHFPTEWLMGYTMAVDYLFLFPYRIRQKIISKGKTRINIPIIYAYAKQKGKLFLAERNLYIWKYKIKIKDDGHKVYFKIPNEFLECQLWALRDLDYRDPDRPLYYIYYDDLGNFFYFFSWYWPGDAGLNQPGKETYRFVCNKGEEPYIAR